MSLMLNNIIVIGSGPHYQKKYHSVLEQEGVKIPLLIDLEPNQKEIQRFFKDKKLKPDKMLFLEERFRNHLTLEEIDAFINHQINLSSIDGVIISTEPKARKAYALWAIQRGLPLFMDKPVTAFSDISNMNKLLGDFNEISKAAKKKKVKTVISCERRAHVGYKWIKDYLKNFINEVRVPITAINIHFAGGVWRLPHEYPLIENHPFKHGYGVLLHSGYHYIDLLVTLLSLNESLFQMKDTKYEIELLASRPLDQIHAIGKNGYGALLKPAKIEQAFSASFQKQIENFGETDLMLIGQLQKNNNTLTNFSVKLFGTSLSMRKNIAIPKFQNLEGKIRQEHITIHLGPLCSLHLISNPLSKLDPMEYPIEEFTVTIMNSPLLQKFKPIIKLNRQEISQIHPYIPVTASLNGYARKWQLREFLRGRDGNSSLESHRETVQLLHSLYSRMKTQLIKNN